MKQHKMASDPNNNTVDAVNIADSTGNVEHVKAIYDFPGRKTKSNVWKYFGFYKLKPGPPSKENLDMSFAVCKICKKTYANKGILLLIISLTSVPMINKELFLIKRSLFLLCNSSFA